jgi:hypothetical protein
MGLDPGMLRRIGCIEYPPEYEDMKDSKRRELNVGDKVRWRGRYYEVLKGVNKDEMGRPTVIEVRLWGNEESPIRSVACNAVDLISRGAACVPETPPVSQAPTAAPAGSEAGGESTPASSSPDSPTGQQGGSAEEPRHVPLLPGASSPPDPLHYPYPLPLKTADFHFPSLADAAGLQALETVKGLMGDLASEAALYTPTHATDPQASTQPTKYLQDISSTFLPGGSNEGLVYPREVVTPFSLWYHPKTGGTYLVLGFGADSTNGRDNEETVVYWSFTRRAWRHRKVREFLDGRFIPIKT